LHEAENTGKSRIRQGWLTNNTITFRLPIRHLVHLSGSTFTEKNLPEKQTPAFLEEEGKKNDRRQE
jgi:hypothetical protein